MISDVLNDLIEKKDLSRRQVAELFDQMLSGELTGSQTGALIMGLACKGVSFEELAGAASAMRSKAKKMQLTTSNHIDTCGTGGDSLGTFNISTATAFVAAGAGVSVAKHGNRSVSSKCGSADVLEAFGVNLDVEPEIVADAVDTIGIGFLFAPKFHSAMKHAAGPRKELGIRSIFNMLGPLTNPAGTRRQLLGVFAPELTEMFANALNLLGSQRAFIVHGNDGLDEISVCESTRISELNNGTVKTYELYPDIYFGSYAEPESLKGGDVQQNAEIIDDIFSGRKSPARDVVVINAAFAITAGGEAERIEEGIKIAEEVIDQGRAKDKLKELAEFA
ncbi:Anthranilate phosphoribosyltransferase 2 [Sedimentisphaera cyanobacteriorum]|uniref:Anthranilate phosphoribosyltransferase n=1 Tax=Sedimentisphaera cyanobacteriorum TaxID=1940790 RepID=A0A1Q2HMG9_9BACT|nr:anthranilate phosphoribosyltransferase [Sedimentisphaera cyanobacteriorum]AQQ08433.1 Anthranilate phosphoribosyltransferase 2 [Sedimentisphaera cyanobacteriorum]